MNTTLSKVTIEGLFGCRNIELPIIDNRLVIVGINGLGKSTVITLLYLALSRQWRRLSEFDFDSITIQFSDSVFTIFRNEIFDDRNRPSHSFQRYLFNKYPSNAIKKILSSPEYFERLIVNDIDSYEYTRMARRLGLSSSDLRAIRNEVNHYQLSLEDAFPSFFRISESVSRLDSFLNENIAAQILYLPTYRRIEKDLKTIFPELEENVKSFNRIRHNSKRNYIELVEFGMEDVDNKINKTLYSLKDSSRAQLSNITSKYLRDVIRGDAESNELKSFGELDDEDITSILNRVEENTLSTTDKTELRLVINRIRTSASGTVSSSDRLIAHFFSKLIELHNTMNEKEKWIVKFLTVCNSYLHGKYLEFDDKKYTIKVYMEDYENRTPKNQPDEDNRIELPLSELSSGEKQIVSLFSHLYLGEMENYFVIIDEPELSLSVDWQKKLLPDIIDSGRCGFLAAVTHSPFIFDNSLDPYAIDLATATKVAP